MGIFQYVKGKCVLLNGVRFNLDVFHALHKDFDIGDAIRVYYDQKKTIYSDGSNQWAGPCPWDQGDLILLRFNDLLMLRRHMRNEIS